MYINVSYIKILNIEARTKLPHFCKGQFKYIFRIETWNLVVAWTGAWSIQEKLAWFKAYEALKNRGKMAEARDRLHECQAVGKVHRLAGKVWSRARGIQHSIPRWWWCCLFCQTDGQHKPGCYWQQLWCCMQRCCQPMENSNQAAILEADFTTCWQTAGTAWCKIKLVIVMECMFVIWICSRPKVSLCFEPHARWLRMQKPYLFVSDLTTCAVRPPQDRPQHWLFYLCDDGTNGQLKLRFLTTLVYWQSDHVLVFVNKALWQFMNPEVVFNPPILMQCQNDQDPTWRRPRQSWQQRGLPFPVAKYQYIVCQTQQNSQNGCWHSKQECL